MFMDGQRLRPDQGHIQLLLKVARKYYLDGASQQEIADEVQYSRATVSRLLREARELGIVRIDIDHPLERTVDLEQRLVQEFNLSAAWVAEPRAGESSLDAVSRCAARVVADMLRPDTLIAMSNGTTLSAMVEAMPALRRRDSCVVQMIGTLGQDNQLIDGPDLCRRMAERIGGNYRVMPVPLVVKTSRLASAMRRETSIATCLALGSRPDIAVVGIGVCDAQGSGHIFDGWMTPAINRSLLEAGAVGHLLGHHFDIDGRHIPGDFCQRVVGVTLERLPEMSMVVGVAAGAEKAAAIRGALRGKYINTLIVDSQTAALVLSEPPASLRSS